jgi:hypothetical protein
MSLLHTQGPMVNIMWKSLRFEMYNEGKVDEARQLELNSVEEARCTTLV